jgi:hypothetical protein
MSTDINTLKTLFLVDSDGNKSRIVGIRGSEAGLDYLEISTQSKEQKEFGINTVLRIYASESEESPQEGSK